MARKPQIQARVAEDTKAQIEQYQEQRGISQADAIRRLLRAGLEAETEHGDISDKLQKGYRLSLLLSYLGTFLLSSSLGLTATVALGLTPVTSLAPMLAVLVALLGIAIAIVTIALTLGLEAARVYTQSDVAPNLGRFDIRKVVLS